MATGYEKVVAEQDDAGLENGEDNEHTRDVEIHIDEGDDEEEEEEDDEDPELSEVDTRSVVSLTSVASSAPERVEELMSNFEQGIKAGYRPGKSNDHQLGLQLPLSPISEQPGPPSPLLSPNGDTDTSVLIGSAPEEPEEANEEHAKKTLETAKRSLPIDDITKSTLQSSTLSECFLVCDDDLWLKFYLAAFGSACTGLMVPLLNFILGSILDQVKDPENQEKAEEEKSNITPGELAISITSLVWPLAIIAGLSYLGTYYWQVFAAQLADKWAERYLQAVMRQDVAWFDTNQPETVASGLHEKLRLIKEAFGDRSGKAMQGFATFFGGFIVSFFKNVQFAGTCLAVCPPLVIIAMFASRWFLKMLDESNALVEMANVVALESLSGVKTLNAFSGHKRAIDVYMKTLQEWRTRGYTIAWRMSSLTSLMDSTMLFYTAGFFAYAVATLADKLESGDCEISTRCEPSAGDMLSIYLNLQAASTAVMYLQPFLNTIGEARTAVAQILKVCRRAPPIDVSSDAGPKLTKVVGKIHAKDVYFAYASRPSTWVANGYSIEFDPGKTTALVGSSGSGKSTIIALLLRFYDPVKGKIMLDGVDIRELNLRWWRRCIGVVGQEPALFQGTIAQNIAYGKQNATRREVERAALKASAHEFILSLPDGYDTLVGEGGSRLSGGQKQRIAIARALVKVPVMLLLDEATSALDNRSERLVWRALTNLQNESTMTIIVIAHRLSSIKGAQKIAVISDGRVVEEGTHAELIQTKGSHYRTLHSYSGVAQERRKAATSGEAYKPKPRLMMLDMYDEEHPSDEEEYDETAFLSAKHKDKENTLEAMDGSSEDRRRRNQIIRHKVYKELKEQGRVSLLGIAGAIMYSATTPGQVMAMVFGINLLFSNLDGDDMRLELNRWVLFLVLMACIRPAAGMMRLYTFLNVSNQLSYNVRAKMFAAYLRQDMAWYDEDENTPGALVQRLNADTVMMNTITGEETTNLICNLFIFVFAFSLSLSFAWQFVLSTVPICVFFALVLLGLQFWLDDLIRDDPAVSHPPVTLCTSIIVDIRTVSSLVLDRRMAHNFSKTLVRRLVNTKRLAMKEGVTVCVQLFVLSGFMGVTFIIGSVMIQQNIIIFENMIASLILVMTAVVSLGTALGSFTLQDKTYKASARIFDVIDRKPPIDSMTPKGKILDNFKAHIVFQNVIFCYPSRPSYQILNGLSFEVNPGQVIALCGPSGSGKSTVVSLLLRYYDTTKGTIYMGEEPLNELNVRWLRRQIGLVSQEPVLFKGNIRDNIVYGIEQPDSVSDDDVIMVANMANAHNFICGLEEGYATQVNKKGTNISGGQKQRIAIARALIKKPALLLLDEATSALDTQSEALVQSALDNLICMKDMTTLVIAHRLSTIQNADQILCLVGGQVEERGTHQELLDLGGFYHRLATESAIESAANRI